jgi:undecaprenyl diphosphate synthase
LLERLKRWLRRPPARLEAAAIDREMLPRHIAIIMDGNGRWAKRRGLPRVAGHRAGMTQVREIIRACDELGIPYLTLYAFSTENWKRPRPEVEYLMRLPEEFFRTEIDELVARRVQVRFIGDIDRLPEYTRRVVDETLRRTSGNDGMVVSFALNYGGRAEIVGAVRRLAELVAEGRVKPDEVSEALFSQYLSTAGLPDPDLIIRTSGERRLSNFLLWQSAYSELWFTDVLWPDFGKEGLHAALLDYQRRQRRFGGLK